MLPYLLLIIAYTVVCETILPEAENSFELQVVDNFPSFEKSNNTGNDVVHHVFKQTSHHTLHLNTDDAEETERKETTDSEETENSKETEDSKESEQSEETMENESKENAKHGPVKVHLSICKHGKCESIKREAKSSTKKSSRKKREAESTPLCEMEVHIDAFEKNYTLCLFTRKFQNSDIVKQNYNSINVTVFKEGNLTLVVPLSTMELEYISGYILNEPFSSVDGYLMDHHFFGVIYIQDQIHYMEPSLKKSQDLHVYMDGLKVFIPKNDTPKEKAHCKPRTCELTIVADHFFHEEVGKSSLHNTVMLMLWHVKEANRYFAVADFNDDHVSECLRLTVGEITVFTTQNSSSNILDGDYPLPEDFLKRFSRYNFEGYCLGALFTSREFTDLVLGLAWRGTPIPDGVGGACQSRVRIKEDVNAYSFNSLFISLRSIQEKRIPVKMGVLNLVHEILHSFGAKHDPEPEERQECTPLDKHFNGRFLMSKYSNDGHKLNHQIMSPCTKESVYEMISKPDKLQCLQTLEDSVCGNGIVETGEECDCGTSFMCTAAKSCCTSPEGYGNLAPCKNRTEKEGCKH